MHALFVLLILATIIYLLIYQPNFYKFYFGMLIPYYIITQLFFCDSKINSSKKNILYHHGTIPLIVKYIAPVQ